MSGTIKHFLDPAGIVLKGGESPFGSKGGEAASAAASATENAAKSQAEQMALRQQEMGRAAVGAGISESDSDIDKLGATARRRQASRALLGGGI